MNSKTCKYTYPFKYFKYNIQIANADILGEQSTLAIHTLMGTLGQSTAF